jgi:mannan endo-1,4-beta-mannosidase
MKKVRIVATLVGVLILTVTLVMVMQHQSQSAKAAAGFHISGRNLVDYNGNNFIIRGISHAHVWYTSQTSSFANIKAAGANTVRVVLGGGRWGPSSASDVQNVINLCKTNRLVCVLEDHDTTGYGEDSAATSLATAVNYWKSIQSVLTGQENWVIINIGNEPYGNNNAANWVTDTKNAITAMRNAGFQHTLMVDAPNWGQDWQFVMRDNAASIKSADTTGNTIFSIHMYGVFDTAAEIQSYISSFVSKGLPLVIGEFGWNHSDGNPDEDTIMAQAQSNGIGYMGWSWSGNGSGVEYLDMVTNFDPSQRTSWGTRFITGANGLSTTSKECSCYNPVSTPTPTKPVTVTVTPPRTPTPGSTPTPGVTPTPITGLACKVTYGVNQWSGGFTANITIANTGTSAINGWTLRFTFPDVNQKIALPGWSANWSQSGQNVTTTNMSWNAALAPSGSTNIGFNGTWSGSNPTPSSFTLNNVTCAKG